MPEIKPSTIFTWDHSPLAKHYEVRLDNAAGDRALTRTWTVSNNAIHLYDLLQETTLTKVQAGILVVVAVGHHGERADAVLRDVSFDFSKLAPATNLRIKDA